MPSQTYGEKKVEEEVVEPIDTSKKPVEESVEDRHVEQPEYSAKEQEAMAKGWKPEGVEGKPNLSAEEFLRNEEFFDRIHKQNRTIKGLEKQLDEMAKQHAKIADIEREKALNELKQAKKLALEDDNFDKVIEIDDKISELNESKKSEQPTSSTETDQNIDPDFYTWQARNSWYDPEKNPDLFQEATALGKAYNSLTGVAGLELYEHVAKQMKALHPDKFGGGPVSTQQPTVEGNARSPRPRQGKKTYTKADLNDVQRRVMDRYVRSGIMSEKEYIDELVAIGEIG